MCESTVYSTDGNIIMEDVLHIKIDREKLIFRGILGHEKKLEGKIVELDLDKHSIFVKLNE